VQVEGRVDDGGVLGELVATSRRLKELHVESNPDAMAESLRRITVAAAGQPGPLSQLEDIGTLRMRTGARGLEGLQAVLVDRGCRSIKKLSIKLEDWCIDSSIFATLSAIEASTRAVCVRPDIPVDVKTAIEVFDLSLLCDTPTSPEPSPFVQRHIQELVAKASEVSFTIAPTTSPPHSTRPAPLPSSLHSP